MTIAPAAAISDTVAVSQVLTEEIFRDPVNLIYVDLAEKRDVGIFTGTLTTSADSAEASVSPDVEDSFGGSGPRLALLSALGSLPENRGVWLIAVSPWIWSVIVWHSRPRWRRRIRRRRY